jgi:adenylosuccinate synthase
MLEFGTVTGRQRRAAPFSKELAKRSILLNGATQVSITKLDTLYPSAAGVRKIDDLDEKPRAFIESLEKELKVPITLVGTGSEAGDIIDMRKEKGF